MTKVVKLIAENEVTISTKKAIDAIYLVDLTKGLTKLTKSHVRPSSFENVALLPYREQIKSGCADYDVFVSWDKDGTGCTFWGHWNDGVI